MCRTKIKKKFNYSFLTSSLQQTKHNISLKRMRLYARKRMLLFVLFIKEFFLKAMVIYIAFFFFLSLKKNGAGID